MAASVLLADDDIELSAMLKEYLEREGFAVTVVHDGEAAARAALGGSHQIVVLDVMMPKVDSAEARARNAGRVVGKNEISEQALGRPLARFDRSIDVHLSAIRQKLGDGANLIRTVRGMGYHLVKE